MALEETKAWEYRIIQNSSILVEIGPDYFYGPSYFPIQTGTNVVGVDRSRITAFDLTKDIQNKVLEAAVKHLTQNSDIVKLAYLYDDTVVIELKTNRSYHFKSQVGLTSKRTFTPSRYFKDMGNLGFMKNLIGKCIVLPLSEFDTPENVLDKILIEGSYIIVLNVRQDAALKILKRAEEKNVLQHPFYWIVFNAGITLSGEQFNVDDTNFYAIEFSTNGNLQSFPELSNFATYITPQDLICRDTAVKALVKVQSQLSQTAYMVKITQDLQIEAGFQPRKSPPSRASLLQLMKKKGLRLGAVVKYDSGLVLIWPPVNKLSQSYERSLRFGDNFEPIDRYPDEENFFEKELKSGLPESDLCVQFLKTYCLPERFPGAYTI
ncbi:hypothetical protein ACTXT7_000998 [Hymenolepis weldensis]